jgi:hypothetical protein
MMGQVLSSETIRDNDKVLYLHVKGAGREGIQDQVNASFWRRYMEYFVIERWEDCIRVLDVCDACGGDINWHPWPHFSGNMWWANAGYLRTLPDPEQLTPSDPVRWELRIGESSRRMALHELWNSGVNHYLVRYLPEMYRGQQPKCPPMRNAHIDRDEVRRQLAIAKLMC